MGNKTRPVPEIILKYVNYYIIVLGMSNLTLMKRGSKRILTPETVEAIHLPIIKISKKIASKTGCQGEI